jgi:hypothetical protein
MHLTELFTTPRWYPVSIDWPSQNVRFVEMSAETYRTSTFLDSRLRVSRFGSELVSLGEITRAATDFPLGPINYIFHGAFCCSTLLARYLEAMPECFVLKEPYILSQFAYRVAEDDYCQDCDFLPGLRAIVWLLGRTFHPGQRVVIKLCDVCNLLSNALLELSSPANSAFVIASLTEFILSSFNSSERVGWIASRLRYSKRYPVPVKIPAAVLADSMQSPTRRAAALWLMNRLHAIWLQASCPGRIRLWSAAQISETPSDVLTSIFAHLGIASQQETLDEALAGTAGHSHAKDIRRPFSRESRRRQLADLDAEHGAEAQAAAEWLLTLMAAEEGNLGLVSAVEWPGQVDRWEAAAVL